MKNFDSLDPIAPIFVGGFFKSGTTLLRVMLAKHTNIYGALETYWFDWPWFSSKNSFSLARGVPNESSESKTRSFLGAAFDMSNAELDMIIDTSSRPEVMLDKLFGLASKRNSKARWVEKTPGNILYTDRIREYWPRSKIIHIYRHPLDVFASNRRSKKGGRDDIIFFCKLWAEYMVSAQHARKTLPPSNFLEIRYENLVNDPTSTMKAIFKFVGESWELGLDEFDGDSDDYYKLLKLTGVSNSTLEVIREPLLQDRQNVWKSSLSKTDIRALETCIEAKGLLDIWNDFKAI